MATRDDGRQEWSDEDLARAYDEARRPYRETITPIPEEAFTQSTGDSSWRYFVEINSACDLHCPMCIQGDTTGFSHKNGIISQELFERIIDKIQRENLRADVCLYGNSEPFLHPRLAQCIRTVRDRGLTCIVSTNFNHCKRLREVVEAAPSILIVSLSGFTQDVYARAHRGGNIETVKENLRRLSALRADLGSELPVLVHYHLYRDNWGEEYDRMKALAVELGFAITGTWARAISMEKAIQFLRRRERERTGHVPAPRPGPEPGGLSDWQAMIPDVTDEFVRDVQRLGISPEEATAFYARFPTPVVCPVGDLFTYIRYDGSVSLCSCFADRRLQVATDFLQVSQEQIRARRRGQSICHECLRYKMHMYFHILDEPMWDGIMATKFPDVPLDRRKF